MTLVQLSSYERKNTIKKALPGQKPGSAAGHRPRQRRSAVDPKVEYITHLQGVSRLNQNELELKVSDSQMRCDKNSTVRRIVEHIDNTFEIDSLF